MSIFIDRIIRAAKLDVQLYEEVEADTKAMRQAMGIVVLSSIAAGIGNVARGGLGGILSGTIVALIGWYIWPISLTLLEQNSFQSHRPKQIQVSYCVLLAFRALQD